MVFQCTNIRQVPWEVLKTAAFGLGFQHLARDRANVNAWKNIFDPYNDTIMLVADRAIMIHDKQKLFYLSRMLNGIIKCARTHSGDRVHVSRWTTLRIFKGMCCLCPLL